jgi:hypothetical protein
MPVKAWARWMSTMNDYLNSKHQPEKNPRKPAMLCSDVVNDAIQKVEKEKAWKWRRAITGMIGRYVVVR